jgi:hypothetical protein
LRNQRRGGARHPAGRFGVEPGRQLLRAPDLFELDQAKSPARGVSVIVTHASPPKDALGERVETNPVGQFCRVFDIPYRKIGALARRDHAA